MEAVIFLICFVASLIGAICGIGGGIIIKPVLEAIKVMPVSTISFLSGITVLCMSVYSVITGGFSKNTQIKMAAGFRIALGAALGGAIGKKIFKAAEMISDNSDRVGIIQAVGLLILTLMTLIYTLNKNKIKTLKMKNSFVCIIIGSILGTFSSFLGVGGGPFNLMFLNYFFSMQTKEAAINSLFIIMCSQISGMFQMVISSSIPQFNKKILVIMIMAGIIGGMAGRKLNKMLSVQLIDRLFIIVMVIITYLCLHNIYIHV